MTLSVYLNPCYLNRCDTCTLKWKYFITGRDFKYKVKNASAWGKIVK
jgi:hypothetical protein